MKGECIRPHAPLPHHGNVHGLLVGLTVDGHRANAETSGCAEDPAGNLAAVGHQNTVKQTNILA